MNAKNYLKLSNSNIKVSSVLNRDHGENGKKYLVDGNTDTCWISEHGHGHWILICFDGPYKPRGIELQTQGGFTPRKLFISYLKDELVASTEQVLIKDDGLLQVVHFRSPIECDRLQVELQDCSDQGGRIIMYSLAVFN